MAPITGFVSFIGTEQLHWAQYSLDKFNKANGTSFTLSQFDTQDLDPALAALGATRLSADKSVFGVVGPAGSQEVRAAGPHLQEVGHAVPVAVRDKRRPDIAASTRRSTGSSAATPSRGRRTLTSWPRS